MPQDLENEKDKSSANSRPKEKKRKRGKRVIVYRQKGVPYSHRLTIDKKPTKKEQAVYNRSMGTPQARQFLQEQNILRLINQRNEQDRMALMKQQADIIRAQAVAADKQMKQEARNREAAVQNMQTEEERIIIQKKEDTKRRQAQFKAAKEAELREKHIDDTLKEMQSEAERKAKEDEDRRRAQFKAAEEEKIRKKNVEASEMVMFVPPQFSEPKRKNEYPLGGTPSEWEEKEETIFQTPFPAPSPFQDTAPLKKRATREEEEIIRSAVMEEKKETPLPSGFDVKSPMTFPELKKESVVAAKKASDALQPSNAMILRTSATKVPPALAEELAAYDRIYTYGREPISITLPPGGLKAKVPDIFSSGTPMSFPPEPLPVETGKRAETSPLEGEEQGKYFRLSEPEEALVPITALVPTTGLVPAPTGEVLRTSVGPVLESATGRRQEHPTKGRKVKKVGRASEPFDTETSTEIITRTPQETITGTPTDLVPTTRIARGTELIPPIINYDQTRIPSGEAGIFKLFRQVDPYSTTELVPYTGTEQLHGRKKKGSVFKNREEQDTGKRIMLPPPNDDDFVWRNNQRVWEPQTLSSIEGRGGGGGGGENVSTQYSEFLQNWSSYYQPGEY